MEVSGKKILIFIVRRLWLSVALLLVGVAVLVSVGRQAINELENYRLPLNQYVSDLVGSRFYADSLSGSWDRLIPSITAKDIIVYGGPNQNVPAITLSSLTFDLNLSQSLLSWDLIWNELSFGRTEIALEEDEQGQWSLAGLPIQGGSSNSNFLDVLFLSDHIEIEELQVTLEFYSGTRTTIDARQMLLESDGDFRRIKAALALDEHEEAARIVVEGSSKSGDLKNFVGKGYLKFNKLNFSGSINAIAKNWFPEWVEKIGEIETDLTAEFWLDIQGKGQLDWVGDISAAELPLNWLADVEPLTDFHAEVTGWFKVGESWGLRWQDIDFEWGSIDIEPLNVVYSQQMGASWGQGSLYLSQLNLATLQSMLLGTQVAPKTVVAAFENLNPKGVVRHLQLDVDLGSGSPDVRAKMNLDDLSVESWRGAPAGRQVNGYAELHNTEGFVELDSPNGFAMHYPQVYPTYMEHSAIKGQVRWRLDREADAVKVASGPMDVGGEEGVSRAYLYLDIPLNLKTPKEEKRSGEMFLLVGARDTHSKYRDRYIPKALNKGLLDWLEVAPKDIEVDEVGFIWRGGFKGGGPVRTVQLHINANQGELQFQPDWLPLKDIQAHINLDDAEMNGALLSAKLGDVQLDSAQVKLLSVPDLDKSTIAPVLQINSLVKTDAGHALSVLKQSPLASSLAALEDWNVSGPAKLNVDLTIPLKTERLGEQYQVDADLQGVLFAEKKGKIAFENLYGDLRYQLDQGLSANNIKGLFWGQPIKTRIESKVDGQKILLSVKSSTSITAEALSQYLDLPPMDVITGQTAVEAELVLPFSGYNVDSDSTLTDNNSALKPSLNITSSLKGYTVDLPLPFGKSRETELATDVTINFADILDMKVQLGTLAQIRASIEDGNVTRAIVGVNREGLSLPPEGQFHIEGRFSRFILSDWLSLYDRWKVNSDGASPSIALQPYLQLHLDQLQIEQYTLEQLKVDGSYEQSLWQLEINSEQAAGDILINPSAERPVTLALERLSLPASKDQEIDPLADFNPADLPPINFSVQDFSVGEKHYGSASFGITPLKDGALFTDIHANVKGFYLGDKDNTEITTTQLLWKFEQGQHSSHFNGVFHAYDIGDVLENNGLARVIDSKSAYSRVTLEWPENPLNFNAQLIKGSMAIELKKGNFYKSPAGATNVLIRTIGLFNFANWARRLRLDFSDFLKKGMSYDVLSGGLYFDNGKMDFIPAMVVDMPSGRMKMLGSADLINETIDAELVTTLPVGTNLPWVAALIGGLPAAAGVYVTGKIFEKQVDQLSSIGYKIQGSWDDPEIEVNKIFSDKMEKRPTSQPSQTSADNEQSTNPSQANDREISDIDTKAAEDIRETRIDEE